MDAYSFALEPSSHQPSGTCNFSRIDNVNLNTNKVRFEKNKFYFSDFGFNEKQFKRKYNNDWSELREFVGFNDIKLIDNELIILNLSFVNDNIKIFATNYNILRIMAGMGGLAYS